MDFNPFERRQSSENKGNAAGAILTIWRVSVVPVGWLLRNSQLLDDLYLFHRRPYYLFALGTICIASSEVTTGSIRRVNM